MSVAMAMAKRLRQQKEQLQKVYYGLLLLKNGRPVVLPNRVHSQLSVVGVAS